MLEQHGYPPLLMGWNSVDMLDHVIFVYRQRGKWGRWRARAIPACMGASRCSVRRARWPKAIATRTSIMTGCVTGYAVVDLQGDGRTTGGSHAATSGRSRTCCSKLPHCKIKRSRARVRRERQRYRAYLAKHNKKPLYYRGREKWTEIPKEFL